MITNLHKNCMGTVSLDGKFDGMRKAQDFIIYPMREASPYARIQSDTRMGAIDVQTGEVTMSNPHSGGAYGVHYASEAHHVGKLSGEELLLFKSAIMGTAHGMAGTNGIVYCDNSGALEVFGTA